MLFIVDVLYNLTYFIPLVSFYTPWKHQKTSGFLIFSGDIEREQCMEWVKWNVHRKITFEATKQSNCEVKKQLPA